MKGLIFFIICMFFVTIPAWGAATVTIDGERYVLAGSVTNGNDQKVTDQKVNVDWIAYSSDGIGDKVELEDADGTLIYVPMVHSVTNGFLSSPSGLNLPTNGIYIDELSAGGSVVIKLKE